MRIVSVHARPDDTEISLPVARWHCTYQLGNFSMALVRQGDTLLAQIRDQKIQLVPESVRDYLLKGTDTQIIFVTDGNGRAKELIAREGGTDAFLNRIK